MSKKHYTPSRNGGSGAKITAIIALFLSLIVGAYVVLSLVFKSWNPVRWTETKQDQTDGTNAGDGNDKEPDDNNGGDNTDKPDLPAGNGNKEGSLFQVTPIASSNKLMRMNAVASEPEKDGIASQAANSTYTLTASLDPFETTDQTVSWDMEWVNGSSSFASEKHVADYVQMTIPEEGSKTVTLQAKQAFGERIKVIATSNSNPDATAFCVLDYAKRVTGLTGMFGSDLIREQGSGDKVMYKCSATSGTVENGDTIGLFLGLEKGVGTYNDTFTTKVTYRPEVSFFHNAYSIDTVDYGISIEFSGDSPSFDPYSISGGKLGYGRWFLLTGTNNSSTWAFADFAANEGVKYLMQNPNTAIGTVTVQSTGTYSSYSHTYFVYADTASLTVVAENLGLSDDNIIM